MRIVLPKTLCKIDPLYGPFFFLAGPIRGGGNWQLRCCDKIRQRIPDFYAASPCRYKDDHPLMKFRYGEYDNRFDRQLTWERHYLDIAANIGCILFWLPMESKDEPRTGEGPYAMDTRGELGEWRGRLMNEPHLKVVIGAEAGFPGLSQIQRNFNFATKTDFPIYGSLSETISAAIEKAGTNKKTL